MSAEPLERLPDRIPRHVAIIMDGNGRWAEARGLNRSDGHEEGAVSVREIVRACRAAGVKALTLYSFSTENWNRPYSEVKALMTLLQRYLIEEEDEILSNDIRFRAMGQLERLPPHVREPLEALTLKSDTGGDIQMELCLALSYGGRAELVDAVKAISAKVSNGELELNQLDEKVVQDHLYAPDLPEPDLLIRTSGEMRLSNFMLWQLAYAEIIVTDTLWPDFRKPELIEAFAAFAARERRFGKTSAQLETQ
jgi:undecaprenyl diphosphate synthase